MLLSHAHQDHNGYLGHLRADVPVYTGLMTALIGKGMQDLGGGEFSYIAPKKLANGGVLKGVTRLRQGRPHYICETDPAITAALGAEKGPGPALTCGPEVVASARPGRRRWGRRNARARVRADPSEPVVVLPRPPVRL